MIPRRLLPLFLTALFVLMLAASMCEGAGRWNAAEEIPDVEATVLSLRRYDHGTYLGVMRDDGRQEWIDIGRDEGLEVRTGQRVAYSPRSRPYESRIFGWVRTAHDFRLLQQQQEEERIYHGSGPDGTIILTDNPSAKMTVKGSTPEEVPKKTRKKAKKSGSRTEEEDVVVVDQEDLVKQKEMTEEYYRYLERTNIAKPVRRAKRARPQ